MPIGTVFANPIGQVALDALRILWLLIQVALVKAAISKLLRYS